MRWLFSVARLSAVVILTLGGSARGQDPAPAAPDTRSAAGHEDAVAALDGLYSEGQRRFAAGDFNGAIQSFEGGLARLEATPDPRLHAYFAVSLAIAHLEVYERDGGSAALDRADVLLRATIQGSGRVLAGEPQLEALARRNLARVDAHLARNTPAPVPTPTSTPTSAPVVPAEPPERGPAQPAPAAGGRRPMALAFLLTGTVLAVGGLALLVDGATLEVRARAIAEDPPQGAQLEYIQKEVPRLQRIRYAIAGPVLAAGVGFVVAGGILMSRASKPSAMPRRLGVGVSLAPGTAGLRVRGRF